MLKISRRVVCTGASQYIWQFDHRDVIASIDVSIGGKETVVVVFPPNEFGPYQCLRFVLHGTAREAVDLAITKAQELGWYILC